MPADLSQWLHLLFRWTHFAAGITWIGLLYWFNLVNVPFAKTVEAKDRPTYVSKLIPSALWWFRHSAWVTVLAGFGLIYVLYWNNGAFLALAENRDKTIFMGMLLGVIMLFNVWRLIWPNQRTVIEATIKGEKPDAQAAKIALYASRVNFALSAPLLLFMAGASHFPLDWSGIVIIGGIAALIGALVVLRVQKVF
ncbi:MAG: urate hydroxylase PuuD [Chloroflexi bacterium]|nr:urate hydroxylase PuuD [Chloroflexota bacterium]